MRIKQQGSALISALFIMTLIAIAATAMSSRVHFDIYRTRLTVASDKLYLASQAITFWAMDKVADPKQRFRALNAEGKLMDYPKQLQHIYPDIGMKGALYDLQARFNVNNLQDTEYHVFFYGLLGNTLKNTTSSQRKFIIQATTNWISTYQPDRGLDKLSSIYIKRKPAYFPAYQLMQNASELRLVAGMDAQRYQSLAPFITALPEVTPINMNTAPKVLLSALGNGLNESQVNELLSARKEKYIENLTEIDPLTIKLNILKNEITTESNYFLCIATTSTPDLEMTVYSVLQRSKDKQGKFTVKLLSESVNTP